MLPKVIEEIELNIRKLSTEAAICRQVGAEGTYAALIDVIESLHKIIGDDEG